MNYDDKVKIAKKVIGWAMYNDISIEESINSLNVSGLHKNKVEWVNNIDRIIYMNDEFDEEFYYFD